MSDKTGLMLKAATRRALDMAGKPENFQHVTRVKAAALSRYGSTSDDHSDAFMPIDVALEADMEAGSPIITAELARLQGFRLVPDTDAPPAPDITHRDISTLNLLVGDLTRVAHEALDDEELDQGEKRLIARKAEEVKRGIRAFMAKLGAPA